MRMVHLTLYDYACNFAFIVDMPCREVYYAHGTLNTVQLCIMQDSCGVMTIDEGPSDHKICTALICCFACVCVVQLS